MNNLLFLGTHSTGLGIIYAILVVFCIVDIMRSTFKDNTTKLLWLAVVIFAPVLGSIAYLLVGRGGKT